MRRLGMAVLLVITAALSVTACTCVTRPSEIGPETELGLG